MISVAGSGSLLDMNEPMSNETIIARFNDAFQRHDPSGLDSLIAPDCVMESVEPAPNGTRYEGKQACLAFWAALAADTAGAFQPEDVAVFGDRATIRWRYQFGPTAADSVRGVNIMRMRDGQIVEALGYVKSGDTGVAQAINNAMPA